MDTNPENCNSQTVLNTSFIISNRELPTRLNIILKTFSHLTIGLNDKVVISTEHVDESVEEDLPNSIVEFKILQHLTVSLSSDPLYLLCVVHTCEVTSSEASQNRLQYRKCQAGNKAMQYRGTGVLLRQGN